MQDKGDIVEIQVIISTMHNKKENLDVSVQEKPNLIVINQNPNILDSALTEKKLENYSWIDIDQKGLSKSRNLGIKKSYMELLYLSDDDIVLNSNFDEIVLEAFKNRPDADIIAFQVSGIERKFKEYSDKPFKSSYLSSLKFSSVQLVYKKSFLIENNLLFDVNFGAGAVFKMGEENIFLFDCLKKNANIYYEPKEIAKVHMDDSSWFEGFNYKYFFDRGAIFYRMMGPISNLYSLLFCIRKAKLIEKPLNIWNAYLASQEGKKEYLRMIRQN
ncbi:glycosyltransferase family A protein [Aerococcus urinaeequi]|uniref:glycosyltransferase family A protein n=1 Tax=Aerococcus urinaeequi TaxID=51665 RepID=UPI003D6C5CA8